MAYISNFLTQSSLTAVTSLVLALPPHEADDVIVLGVSADNSGTVTLSASAGWIQIGSTQTSGALLTAAVWYKKATGTNSETCTIGLGATGDVLHVHMFILKDVDTTTQLDASAAAVYAAALNFNTPTIVTTTTDCLILYYIAKDDATTTPSASHSNPGPMHFLDSSDNGGGSVTLLASGAAGWYIQRAIGTTPVCNWDNSSNEIYADFVMAFRNKSGGYIPPYVDDSATMGQRLMTGSWWVAATTRNNQNFKATPLTIGFAGKVLVTTGASGTGAIATLTFAEQPAAPYAIGLTITVVGVTPTGYNATAVVTACTTTSVSYANTTTGAQTVAGMIQGVPTTFDAGAVIVDAGLNPYSSAINSTPSATTTNASGFELIFITTEYNMTTGWIVGAFQTSTSKMALFNQGSIAQGGTYLIVGKAFNALATTVASGTGAIATITFAAQSIAIPVGAQVVVAGVTPTGYNTGAGGATVTASSTTTVSYANTTTGDQTVAGTVTANQYRSFNIMARNNQDGEGSQHSIFSVMPNQTTTPFGFSAGNVLPITKIDRLWILHKGQNAAGAFYYCDFHLIQKVIAAGGTATLPVDTQGLFDIGRYVRVPLLKKSGAFGLVAYVPVQIGGGDAINFQIDAGALQFPRIFDTTKKEINYHGSSGSIGISYAGKSGDVIKHTNSVVTSPSPYYWEINSAATNAATWDFTGLVVVGANVTLRNVMTFNAMAFSSCPTLNFTGCTVTGATISKVPAGNDTLTTSSSTVISGSKINVTGVTAGNYWCSVASPVIFQNNDFIGSASTGHAIRITDPGTYAFVGNTFTGGFGANGTSSAAILNESSGLVTLNVSEGDSPTYKNIGGATTTVNNTKTLTLTGLIAGSDVRVLNAGTQTVLAETDNSGTTFDYIYTYGAYPQVDIVVLHLSYEYFRLESFTPGSTNASLPIPLRIDRNYL